MTRDSEKIYAESLSLAGLLFAPLYLLPLTGHPGKLLTRISIDKLLTDDLVRMAVTLPTQIDQSAYSVGIQTLGQMLNRHQHFSRRKIVLLIIEMSPA